MVIAVLKIMNSTLQNQSQPKPLQIVNSPDFGVEDQVITIGNPFGLSDTMTIGIVSGIGVYLRLDLTQGFCDRYHPDR